MLYYFLKYFNLKMPKVGYLTRFLSFLGALPKRENGLPKKRTGTPVQKQRNSTQKMLILSIEIQKIVLY